MIWLFFLGIIALAVYHAGFRKVLLCTAGGGAVVFGVLVLMAWARGG